VSLVTEALKAGLAFQSDVAAAASAARLMRSPMRLCSFGNSIAGAASSFARFASTASRGLLVYGQNAGVSGNRSAQMVARLDTIEAGIDVAFLIEGTNDATDGVTTAAHVASLDACISYMLNKGITPVMVMPPPKTGLETAMGRYWLADYALARLRKIPVVFPWAFCFATAGTGAWNTAYSTDGIHPTTAASAIAGQAMIDQLRGDAVCLPLPVAQSAYPGLFTTNALMLTDTNTDGVPDSWNVTNSGGSATNALASNGTLGNWFSMERANQASTTFSNLSRAVNVGFSVGDRVLCVGRVKTESMSNAQLKLYVDMTNSGQPQNIIHQFLLENLADQTFSYEFVVPAGTTGLTFGAVLQPVAASNYSGKVSVAQVQFYNLSTAMS
jgi:lysophospholipase L1-like esterase